MLFGRLFGTGSRVEIPPGDAMMTEAIDSLDDVNGGVVDLRDASDIISPAAVLIAIGNGGSIVGARHVRGKESDRIRTTVEMLAAFGMSARATDDGIEIPGGQFPEKPDSPVETHGDHRLVMTAAVLASKVGGIIINHRSSAVTDPEFIERLTGLGE
jgi:3-phosphoshikimate 1-carboxyvinyltransferase